MRADSFTGNDTQCIIIFHKPEVKESNFSGLKWKFSFGINNGENGHTYTDNSVRHELSQSTFQAGRT